MISGAQPGFVIDKLSRKHDVSTFDCANAILNEWLKKFTLANQQADSARTYVALDGNSVAGYYAITTGSVHKHESPLRVPRAWPIIPSALC
jgi:hypothetical protein